MGRPSSYSPEVRERAVRLVHAYQGEHRSQWAAICSIAEKVGCSSETLRKWVRQTETDHGVRPGLTMRVIYGGVAVPVGMALFDLVPSPCGWWLFR